MFHVDVVVFCIRRSPNLREYIAYYHRRTTHYPLARIVVTLLLNNHVFNIRILEYLLLFTYGRQCTS